MQTITLRLPAGTPRLADYRKLAYQFHPDRAVINGMSVEAATERFKTIVAAYTLLEEQHDRL
jgi:DnaJ-class molecular chaperone